VKPGETAKTQSPHQPSILDGATGWNMRVDLGKKLVFPSIVHTNLRPDIVLWSEKRKKLIMIELTVPLETRCEEDYERKKAKYTELLNQWRQSGWYTWLFPIEVGVRGFCLQLVCRLKTAIGTTGRDVEQSRNRCQENLYNSNIFIKKNIFNCSL
jgi:hypothetical protein